VVAKPDIAKQGVALALTIAVGDSARGLVCSADNRCRLATATIAIAHAAKVVRRQTRLPTLVVNLYCIAHGEQSRAREPIAAATM
jgi:hypothetical protein